VSTPEQDPDRGIYAISVAAELVGLDQQSLRLYEQRQLVSPQRTAGGTRRYSANDLLRLRRIRDLLAKGLNLAGIGMVMDLQDDNDELRGELGRRRHRGREKELAQPRHRHRRTTRR
jgi:MerR family transcriptional regulator, heat shock protein HspR